MKKLKKKIIQKQVLFIKNPTKEENKNIIDRNRFDGIKNDKTILVSFCILFLTEKMTSPFLYC